MEQFDRMFDEIYSAETAKIEARNFEETKYESILCELLKTVSCCIENSAKEGRYCYTLFVDKKYRDFFRSDLMRGIFLNMLAKKGYTMDFTTNSEGSVGQVFISWRTK